MVILAAIRWPHDNHLAILGLIAFVATLLGFVNRRRLLPPWTLWVIPSVVGAPLIARAIVRRSRLHPSSGD